MHTENDPWICPCEECQAWRKAAVRATLYRTDGTFEHLEGPLSMERCRELVGGWVETVWPINQRKFMFLCDEEGLLKRKPWNQKGQELYGPYGDIVGDIIVMAWAEGLKWLKVGDPDDDPTPWCHQCGAMVEKDCDCGPNCEEQLICLTVEQLQAIPRNCSG